MVWKFSLFDLWLVALKCDNFVTSCGLFHALTVAVIFPHWFIRYPVTALDTDLRSEG
jgi:hypothetical protein